jgi:hypothetical protein
MTMKMETSKSIEVKTPTSNPSCDSRKKLIKTRISISTCEIAGIETETPRTQERHHFGSYSRESVTGPEDAKPRDGKANTIGHTPIGPQFSLVFTTGSLSAPRRWRGGC